MKKLLALFLSVILAMTLAMPSNALYKGDVNGDGATNSTDALVVLKYSVGSFVEIDELLADMNDDGKINSSDALEILCISVGLNESVEIHKHNYISVVTEKTCDKNAKVTYTCDSCGNTYDEEVPPISVSMTYKGSSSFIVGAYATISNSYIVNVSGGYGTVLLKYDLYSNTASATPIDTLDYTSSTSYQVSYKGSADSINGYMVKITAKDEVGNLTVCKIDLGSVSVIEQFVLDDHNYSDVDDKCAVCGKIIEYTEGLRFTLINDDTEYAVTSIGSATDADIVIPRTYKDKPVTEIGKSAFEKCKTIKSVRLHSQIKKIDKDAFFLSSLASIYLPEGLECIGSSSLRSCELKSISIPKSVIKLDRWVLSDNYRCVEVAFSEGITIIPDHVLSNCSNLSTVTIPKTIATIEERAFESCQKLTDINFDGNKSEWQSISKGTAWDVGTGNYIIHCTDGDLTKAEA